MRVGTLTGVTTEVRGLGPPVMKKNRFLTQGCAMALRAPRLTATCHGNFPPRPAGVRPGSKTGSEAIGFHGRTAIGLSPGKRRERGAPARTASKVSGKWRRNLADRLHEPGYRPYRPGAQNTSDTRRPAGHEVAAHLSGITVASVSWSDTSGNGAPERRKFEPSL